MREITKSERRKPSAWWAGKELVVRLGFQTGSFKFKPGMRVIVERKYGGLDVVTPHCSECGISVRARRSPLPYFAWPDEVGDAD